MNPGQPDRLKRIGHRDGGCIVVLHREKAAVGLTEMVDE